MFEGSSTGSAWLAGGGEMGARMRAKDWEATPLGPIDTWSQSVKSAVSICLNSRFPIVLWMGPELRVLYNDTYIPFLGETKHPAALGAPGREVWGEIWSTIGPMHEEVAAGRATSVEDQQMFFARKLPREEVYVTFGYSPILAPDCADIEGVFCACTETTKKVIGEQRLATLRGLGRRSPKQRTPEIACRDAAAVLRDNLLDVPFAAIYLMDEDGTSAHHVAQTPSDNGSSIFPENLSIARAGSADQPWPLSRVAETGHSCQVADLPGRVGVIPAGPWPAPIETAIILPLTAPTQSQPAGFLIVGVNPHRILDADYRSFFDLVAGHIARNIADARAFEAERKRAEALAEIDRAKTLFFSNVSHEFRTPLTLMLGPLEDELRENPDAAERMRIVHRSALRLLKLVNTLLDFSRVEAGRARAIYEPTDLATFTVELASVFRSAVEKAGLQLIVDCPPLPEPAFVDREMWEKIVLNLVSNAFKFTFEGEIQVKLHSTGPHVELVVRDTGTGIAADEVPRLFERFHRVLGARGRTHEGSGIGLALVQDLVRLHGGSVEVESVYGQGTTFRVVLPLGSSHLPSHQFGVEPRKPSTATGARPFVEEALRWLPGTSSPHQEAPIGDIAASAPAVSLGNERPCILLADDNADMCEYVRRLLASHYEVETVTDGEAARESIARRVPDLVLADIMMPHLDGLGLLARLRAGTRTRTLPVILVSARAGEETKEEGFAAGADDYLVKPFSARELLAQVAANIRMAKLRRDAEQALREGERRYRTLVAASSDVVYGMSADWGEMRSLIGRDFIADTNSPSRIWLEKYIHPDDRPAITQAINRAIGTKSIFELEHRVIRTDAALGWMQSRAVPLLDGDGKITEWIGAAADITERKHAEASLRRSEAWLAGQNEAFQAAVNGSPLAETLQILIRTAIEQTDSNARGAFYIANRERTELRHVVGMPESYARHVEGFKIGEDSLACGLAVGTGKPVITPDVLLEPRWKPWLWLAQQYDYRGCWSFPVETSVGGIVGTFAMYFREPRTPRPPDLELASNLTHTASIIISRHREAEEHARAGLALHESEARLQAAVKLANLGSYSWNPQTNGLQWDDATRAMWGLPAGAPVDYDLWRAGVHPDDLARVEAAIHRCTDPAGDGVYDVEYRVIGRTDGVERWIATRGQTHFDNRAPVAFLGVALDVTDHKRIEAKLERRVEARTRELEEANRELCAQIDQRQIAESEVQQLQRLDAIGQITSGVAHDFNNLLSVVLTNARLLSRSLRDPDNHEGIELIRAAAERGVNVTAQLLAFSRQQRLEPKEIDLNKTIVEMSGLLNASLRGTVQLQTILAENLWPALVDQTQIASVVLNLTINARDAMRSGGILTFETFNAVINEKPSSPEEPAPGKYVGLAVRDTGVGIPDDVLPRVFEPFFTTKEPGKGSGLGLAQVFGFAKQSGGGVAIKTRVGEGTSMTVFLPRGEAILSARERESDEQVPKMKVRPSILIVDDDLAILRSTVRMLEMLGYASVPAASGEEALRLIASGSRIDLVLADFAMPQMTGVELAKAIKTACPSLPVIIVTGYGNRAGPTEFGDTRILQKPYTEDALIKEIAASLGGAS